RRCKPGRLCHQPGAGRRRANDYYDALAQHSGGSASLGRRQGVTEARMANRPYMTVATRVGLNLLALLGVIIALYLGRSIFIRLVIALLLAALVWPAAYFLNKWLHLSWGASCFLVVIGLVILNLAITIGFFLAVPRMLQDLPDLRTSEGQKEMYHKIREKAG